MQRNTAYTFKFVLIIALGAALLLSIASQSLKKRQQMNIESDIKLNILIASGIFKDGLCTCVTDRKKEKSSSECCTIKCCYEKHIRSLIINHKGEAVESPVSALEISLEEEMDRPEQQRRYPVFIRYRKDKTVACIIPIVGKGLWSTLYGYLALENDYNTLKGITFYQHGETPGLGAEIEKPWFLNNFTGKKILGPHGGLKSVEVVKGKADPASLDFMHQVDGISGATLTGSGVSRLIKSSLLLYEPYFTKLRRNRR